jgi:hypothetical protein
MNRPGLDAVSITEFAGCGEATVVALEREGSQGGEPVKPLRRIRDERKHPLRGRNDHDLSIGTFFKKRKRTSTAMRVGLGRRGRDRVVTNDRGCRSRGRGCNRSNGRGKRGCSNGTTPIWMNVLLLHQRESQLDDLLLKGGNTILQEREVLMPIRLRSGCRLFRGSAFLG